MLLLSRLAAVFLMAALVSGAAQAQTVTVYGGGASCAEWTLEVETTPDRLSGLPSRLNDMQQYLVGYLSGASMTSGVDLWRGMTAMNVLNIVDAVCQLRPQWSIGGVADRMVKEKFGELRRTAYRR